MSYSPLDPQTFHTMYLTLPYSTRTSNTSRYFVPLVSTSIEVVISMQLPKFPNPQGAGTGGRAHVGKWAALTQQREHPAADCRVNASVKHMRVPVWACMPIPMPCHAWPALTGRHGGQVWHSMFDMGWESYLMLPRDGTGLQADLEPPYLTLRQ